LSRVLLSTFWRLRLENIYLPDFTSSRDSLNAKELFLTSTSNHLLSKDALFVTHNIVIIFGVRYSKSSDFIILKFYGNYLNFGSSKFLSIRGNEIHSYVLFKNKILIRSTNHIRCQQYQLVVISALKVSITGDQCHIGQPMRCHVLS